MEVETEEEEEEEEAEVEVVEETVLAIIMAEIVLVTEAVEGEVVLHVEDEVEIEAAVVLRVAKI